MNYYIEGNAANADKIKAAFEKLGYEKVNVIHIGDYANERLFFFTENGKVRSTLKDCGIVHIIKTHPDYKELELPVEFKNGDIIGFNDCTHNDGSYVDWVGIYKRKRDDSLNQNQHLFHCVVTSMGTFRTGGSWRVFTAYLATKEQRGLLFSKMKEAGYEWDEKKKELRKIQPHYDIANFHAGMPVLVRDGNCHEWRYVTFSHYRKVGTPFCAGGQYWYQCIPFNKKTKHLLGTTDMPSEEYINW